MNNSPSFAIYYAGDAYSTANKIMGRQSAGKAFMRGVARTWPMADLHGLGQGTATAKAMYGQLAGDGFAGQLKWIEVPNWAALGEVGNLYYPSPAAKDFAFSRNAFNPGAFSVMGQGIPVMDQAVIQELAAQEGLMVEDQALQRAIDAATMNIEIYTGVTKDLSSEIRDYSNMIKTFTGDPLSAISYFSD
ncbi:MAG: hypothetical protein WCL22_07110, partial [bacterium]